MIPKDSRWVSLRIPTVGINKRIRVLLIMILVRGIKGIKNLKMIFIFDIIERRLNVNL